MVYANHKTKTPNNMNTIQGIMEKVESLIAIREKFKPGSQDYIDSLIYDLLHSSSPPLSESESNPKKRKEPSIEESPERGTPDYDADWPTTNYMEENDVEEIQKPKRIRTPHVSAKVGEVIAVRGNDDKVWYYEMKTKKTGYLLQLEKDYYYLTKTVDEIDRDTVLAYEVPFTTKLVRKWNQQLMQYSIMNEDRYEHNELLRRSIEKCPNGISSLNKVN